jgi:hypothetical protein
LPKTPRDSVSILSPVVMAKPSLSDKFTEFMERPRVFVATQVVVIALAMYSIAAVASAYRTLNEAGADANSLILSWQLAPVSNATCVRAYGAAGGAAAAGCTRV